MYYKNKKRSLKVLNSAINITPFVDVVLVLLIIFMITSPMLTSGIEVNLPTGSVKALTAKEEPIMLSITQRGKLYIEDNEISFSDIADKLKAIFKLNNNTQIFIRGDKEVEYGKIIEIFTLIKDIGYDNVSLVITNSSNTND